jgi:hypothetical protein
MYLFLITLCTVSSPAKDLKAIFDGRLTLKPAKLSHSEEEIIKGKILPEDRRFWDVRETAGICDSNFIAGGVDITQGSFTRPGAVQKAILYRYCTTGHNLALNGIVIIENSEVVAHIVYSGGWDNAIGALPDINSDSLSEIIVAAGGLNQGENWKSISIIQLSGKNVIKFGLANVYSDNFGAGEKNCFAEANKIFVKTGKTPSFFEETYTNKGPCDETGTWHKQGQVKPVTLINDEKKYYFTK